MVATGRRLVADSGQGCRATVPRGMALDDDERVSCLSQLGSVVWRVPKAPQG
jgi:hypothetical protein